MIKTVEEIRKDLFKIWPNFPAANIWLPSGPYEILPLEEIKRLALKSDVSTIQFRANVMECEKFAIFFYSAFHRHAINEYAHTPALGFVTGIHIESTAENIFASSDVHTCNIVFADEGVFLFEPQSNRFFEVAGPIKTSSDDNFLFFIFV
jgi:hypothetical protein